MILAALCLCACSNGTPAPAETESSGIPVTWTRLADSSHGWFEKDKLGVHAERCWKDTQGYRCVQLLRSDPAPGEDEVDMDDGHVTFYSRRTAELESDKVYIEAGYRCEPHSDKLIGFGGTPDATESIVLENGATIQNELYSFNGSHWPTKYVADFVSRNGGTPANVLHFDCLALSAFLERANDEAFLTDALKSGDVFPNR